MSLWKGREDKLSSGFPSSWSSHSVGRFELRRADLPLTQAPEKPLPQAGLTLCMAMALLHLLSPSTQPWNHQPHNTGSESNRDWPRSHLCHWRTRTHCSVVSKGFDDCPVSWAQSYPGHHDRPSFWTHTCWLELLKEPGSWDSYEC